MTLTSWLRELRLHERACLCAAVVALAACESGSRASQPEVGPQAQAIFHQPPTVPIAPTIPVVPTAIHTCAELQAMEHDLDGSYVLISDIDCSGFSAGGGQGFRPVGRDCGAFSGSLDGQGHVITGLRIERPWTSDVGLFGETHRASITRVGLVEAEVRGHNRVGSLVGTANDSTITECYATGEVRGNADVGGLVGALKGRASELHDGYAVTQLTSRSPSGLVVGHLGKKARGQRTYAAGTMSHRARLAGQVDAGSRFDASFFDCDVAGNCAATGAEPTSAMQASSTFDAAAWDLDDVWGFFGPGPSYPCLRWQPGCGDDDACQPSAPDDSSCDAVDQDCDGQLDEDYASLVTSCGIGACSSTGSTSCAGGAVADSCLPGAPQPDTTCDGADDDCDGSSDEAYEPHCSGSSVAICTAGSVELSDCADSDACSVDACASATCVHAPVDTDDRDLCTIDSCDPTTGVAHTPVDTDDADPCTIDSCDPATGVAHMPAAAGTSCGVGLVCDTAGACVPVDPCENGILDPGETDVDCGDTCPVCDDGRACVEDGDCSSMLCLYGFCGPATCGGLAAYWPLDEGAGASTVDEIRARTGSFVGAPSWTAGVLDDALTFDGDDYVRVSDARALEIGTQDFSVSAWVRMPVRAGRWGRIVAHGTHGAGFDGYALMEWCGWGSIPCGGVGLLLGVNGRGEHLIGTCSSMNDGQWHHYAGVLDRDGAMRMYVDGAELAAPCGGTSGGGGWGGGVPGNIAHLAGVDIDARCDLCVGASCQIGGACGAPPDALFDGSVDEVALHHRALVPAEITHLHGGGAALAVCDVEAVCTDGELGAGETDVDCGGHCAPCDDGFACETDADCSNWSCSEGICATATCDGLDAYWPIDEGSGTSLVDQAAGHDGALTGAPVWTSGPLGGALTFDGSDDYVRVPDAPGLEIGTSDFSVSAWVNIPVGSRRQARILSHGAHGAPFDGYALMEWCAWSNVPCGGVALLLGVDGGAEHLIGTCSARDDGLWHHYAATLDRDASIRFYVDGVELTEPCGGTNGRGGWNRADFGDITHLSGIDIDATCDLCIGASCQINGACRATTSEHWSGSLDDVALHGRVLTPGEVASLVDGGAGHMVCEP